MNAVCTRIKYRTKYESFIAHAWKSDAQLTNNHSLSIRSVSVFKRYSKHFVSNIRGYKLSWHAFCPIRIRCETKPASRWKKFRQNEKDMYVYIHECIASINCLFHVWYVSTPIALGKFCFRIFSMFYFSVYLLHHG